MNAFPSDDLAKDLKDLDLGNDILPLQHSLGLCWDLNSDTFTYQISDDMKPFTRRGVLSTINSLFDPLGFISPVVIQGKVLLRDLTSENADWDSPLPAVKRNEWNEWRESLMVLENLRIPRVHVPTSIEMVSREMHIFSDASEKAISAVAFIRTVDVSGKCHVGFVFSKSKLAPAHGHTIPRLELCAAVLAVEIAEILSKQLGVPSEEMKFHTDSKVVLGYIHNQIRRFFIYVGNRVDRIRRFSKPDQWTYVPTDKNPADLGTRFLAAHALKDSTWLLGTPQLRKDHPTPQTVDEVYPLVEPAEDKEIKVDVTSMKTVARAHLGSDRFQKFSKWKNLVEAIAHLKHIGRVYTSNAACHGWHSCSAYKTVEWFQEAEDFVVKEVQRECYGRELHCLKEKEPLPRDSPILALSPIVDSNGVLRVGGRLNRADLEECEKNPIIIPGHHHIATLIVRHLHESVQHQGRHFTDGAIRAAGYWITGGKRLVSSVLFKCVKCRKLRARPQQQKMADLPLDRLKPCPPFTYVGVDVFGPWSVVTRRTRGGSANSKRWAVLFTCLAIRAVHIEIIEDMSASSFINALRRFIALRGNVKEFRSAGARTSSALLISFVSTPLMSRTIP